VPLAIQWDLQAALVTLVVGRLEQGTVPGKQLAGKAGWHVTDRSALAEHKESERGKRFLSDIRRQQGRSFTNAAKPLQTTIRFFFRATTV
jgi:hypothetical protein